MGGSPTGGTAPRWVSRAVLLLLFLFNFTSGAADMPSVPARPPELSPPADVVASTEEIAPLIVGEGGLLDADPYLATVTVLTETEILTFEAAALAAIAKRLPEASTRLLRVMSRHSPVADRR